MNKFVTATVVFLVVLGAINWGLVGAFNFDAIAYFLGAVPIVVKVVYIFIGVAGVVKVFNYYGKRGKG